MSRSGYSYDCENVAMWRGQVASAIRGQRGQDFFKALIEALDALPEKKLIHGDIADDTGCVCALGAMARYRGISPEDIDTYDYEDLGKRFNIAHQLAQEVMFENDEGGYGTPEDRWLRIREWAVSKLRASSDAGGAP